MGWELAGHPGWAWAPGLSWLVGTWGSERRRHLESAPWPGEPGTEVWGSAELTPSEAVSLGMSRLALRAGKVLVGCRAGSERAAAACRWEESRGVRAGGISKSLLTSGLLPPFGLAGSVPLTPVITDRAQWIP